MINLLPWRTLVANYRRKRARRILAIFLTVSGVIIGLLVYFLMNLNPPPLPQPITPTRQKMDPDNQKQLMTMQKIQRMHDHFLSLLQLLQSIDQHDLRLTRITLQTTSVFIRGETPALNAWIHWINQLQKNRQWRIHITALGRSKAQENMIFSLLLTPREGLNQLIDAKTLQETRNQTRMIQEMLRLIPEGLLLKDFQSSQEDQSMILQATGSFYKATHYVETLFQQPFVCPISKIDLISQDTFTQLIFRWHFPCYSHNKLARSMIIKNMNPFHPIHLFPLIPRKPLDVFQKNHPEFIDPAILSNARPLSTKN